MGRRIPLDRNDVPGEPYGDMPHFRGLIGVRRHMSTDVTLELNYLFVRTSRGLFRWAIRAFDLSADDLCVSKPDFSRGPAEGPDELALAVKSKILSTKCYYTIVEKHPRFASRFMRRTIRGQYGWSDSLGYHIVHDYGPDAGHLHFHSPRGA